MRFNTINELYVICVVKFCFQTRNYVKQIWLVVHRGHEKKHTSPTILYVYSAESVLKTFIQLSIRCCWILQNCQKNIQHLFKRSIFIKIEKS